ncbi:hypothetical protein FF80_00372 [Devosia sp. LC5]|nr:hypothetical protein FF80_00372 [Devosia sp. LC5]
MRIACLSSAFAALAVLMPPAFAEYLEPDWSTLVIEGDPDWITGVREGAYIGMCVACDGTR